MVGPVRCLGAVLLVACQVHVGQAAEKPFAVLAADGKARCVVATGDKPQLMERRAAAELATVIARDSGAKVPVLKYSELPQSTPEGPAVILVGTPGSVPMIATLAGGPSGGLGDLPLLGGDGYVVETVTRGKRKLLVIAGQTPRAVFYGAIHAGEQLVLPGAGPSRPVAVASTRMVRTPAMKERAPYLLNLSGRGPEFGLEDWKTVLDGLARESHNRIYFWWQSLYKPRDFPDRRILDGGVQRIRMTNQDVNELARYAHQLGMEFLVGGGAFSWGGAAALVKEFPATKAVKAGGMCPSHPKARELQLKFSLEMLEVINEADGIWFEPRDEHGECRCEVCQKAVDPFGSKQYGQSEMQFLKDFCKLLWAKRPKAQVAWLVELYKPSKMHSEDPAYFQRLKEIEDPRLHWIVVWGAWEFPGPGGKYLPAAYFSRHNIRWSKPYAEPLETIRKDVFRASREGFLGFCPTFEPCFGVDFHGLTVPYPTDKLPYELTSYAFREFCWQPTLSIDGLKQRMRNRYCGPHGSKQLVEDVIFLRAFAIRGNWTQNTSSTLTKLAGEMVGYDGKAFKNTSVAGALAAAKNYNKSDKKITYDRLAKQLAQLRSILVKDLPRIDQIESRCLKLARTGTPRERKTAALCLDFTRTTKRLIKKSGMDSVQKVDQQIEDFRKAVGANKKTN